MPIRRDDPKREISRPPWIRHEVPRCQPLGIFPRGCQPAARTRSSPGLSMKGIKPILLSELIIREPGGRKAGTVHADIGEEENHMNADKAVLDIQRAVLMAEDAFFAALSKGDRRALESAVADDCILIDVLSGSEVPRAVFVEAVGLQLLTF